MRDCDGKNKMPWIDFGSSTEKKLPPSKGSYALFLKLVKEQLIRLPKFGPVLFPTGIYVYTGSAKGSGGLRARVSRHIRVEKSKHWHIDWFRPFAEIIGVYYTISQDSHECNWAMSLKERSMARVLVHGFGASDCKQGCGSHLLFINPDVDLDTIFAVF